MLLVVTNQKIYINGCEKKQTAKGVPYFVFFTSLGKNKGIMNCKCFDMKHDLTKLKGLDRVVVDLTKGKTTGGKVLCEFKIISYAEPQIADGKVDNRLPVKQQQPQPNNEIDLDAFDDLMQEGE